jgi:hypothetical protein
MDGGFSDAGLLRISTFFLSLYHVVVGAVYFGFVFE